MEVEQQSTALIYQAADMALENAARMVDTFAEDCERQRGVWPRWSIRGGQLQYASDKLRETAAHIRDMKTKSR